MIAIGIDLAWSPNNPTGLAATSSPPHPDEFHRLTLTWVVLDSSDAASVTRLLRVGDLLPCPHCRKWHPVVKWHTSGTAYTLRMLYFRCEGQMFYAGQEDLESRHPTRCSEPNAQNT